MVYNDDQEKDNLASWLQQIWPSLHVNIAVCNVKSTHK
jgi:hypothetical protein